MLIVYLSIFILLGQIAIFLEVMSIIPANSWGVSYHVTNFNAVSGLRRKRHRQRDDNEYGDGSINHGAMTLLTSGEGALSLSLRSMAVTENR